MGRDPFAGADMSRSDPCLHLAAVVLDVEFDFYGYLFVQAAGTVAITTAGGEDDTLTVTTVPYLIPILVKKVRTGGSVVVANLRVFYNKPRG